MTTFEAMKILFRVAVREGRAGLLPKDSPLELEKEAILFRDQWWTTAGEWVVSYDDRTCQWITWPRFAVGALHPELVERLGL